MCGLDVDIFLIFWMEMGDEVLWICWYLFVVGVVGVEGIGCGF